MKTFLLTTSLLFGFVASANATLIATFGQTETGAQSQTVVATDNGTTTNINVVNSIAGITTFAGGSLSSATFNLSAVSIDPVVTLGNAIIQHYSGTFCFTSLASCGGTNYLTGTFSDAAFGANGGPGLVLNVNNPPDTLVLTSSVIAASELVAPSSFNLGFTNLTPGLHVDGSTIGAFTASYSGNVSASTAAVPEPTSMALLGTAILGIGMLTKRRKSV
jgi:hypothetical protein